MKKRNLLPLWITLGACGVLALVAVTAAVAFVLVSDLSESASVDCAHGQSAYEGRHVALCGPAAWESTSGGPVLVAFLGPEAERGFRVNLNLVAVDLVDGTTQEGFYDTSLAEMRRTVTDFSVADGGAMEVDGRPATWHEYTARRGVYELHGWQVFFVVAGEGYVLTFDATASTFENAFPAAQDAARSIVLA